MIPSIRPPKLGSLRYQDADGTFRTAQPGETWYSTVSMLATEVYTKNGWEFIFPEDPAPQYSGPPELPTLFAEPPTLKDLL
jgi:hypothetical protein